MVDSLLIWTNKCIQIFVNKKSNAKKYVQIDAVLWSGYVLIVAVSWAILWYLFQMAYANIRENMPCWTKIYPIFGTVTERDFQEKYSKHRNIYIVFGRAYSAPNKIRMGLYFMNRIWVQTFFGCKLFFMSIRNIDYYARYTKDRGFETRSGNLFYNDV